MIKLSLFQNEEQNGCSYCGGTHKEMVQLEEDSHAGAGNHFIMSRRCLHKFKKDLEAFMRLNPSGVK